MSWSDLKIPVMKKSTPLLLLLSLSIGLGSCLKDKCHRTYTMYRPVYHTTAEVRANIKSNAPRALEHPGKLFVIGKYIFLNEVDKGIHIIDNSNPSAPRNVAFVDLPGNIDLAVKENTLYADSYTDMVTLDIADPLRVQVKKFTDNAFPNRRYENGFVADTNKVIVDWIRTDTTVLVDCGGGGGFYPPGFATIDFVALSSSSGQNKSTTPFGAGVGGSMARFTLMNNYLYTVTDTRLNVFNVSSPNDPQFLNYSTVGWNIETIYPFKDRLFIGSNSGMFVFATTDPTHPTQLASFSHAHSCDPIIADDNYAYVTLRSGTQCQGYTNQLDVLNIDDISNPRLVRSYPMTNPRGLSKDGNTLFICDGTEGVKVYDATKANDIKLLKQIGNITSYDVIAFNNRAIVVADDGLYQYDYSQPSFIKLLSKITFNKY